MATDDADRNKRAGDRADALPSGSCRVTCADELAVALVFRLDEVRQNVFVRPADGAVRRPFVIVEPVAAHVQHVVGVARAAETLARVPDAHLVTCQTTMQHVQTVATSDNRRTKRQLAAL